MPGQSLADFFAGVPDASQLAAAPGTAANPANGVDDLPVSGTMPMPGAIPPGGPTAAPPSGGDGKPPSIDDIFKAVPDAKDIKYDPNTQTQAPGPGQPQGGLISAGLAGLAKGLPAIPGIPGSIVDLGKMGVSKAAGALMGPQAEAYINKAYANPANQPIGGNLPNSNDTIDLAGKGLQAAGVPDAENAYKFQANTPGEKLVQAAGMGVTSLPTNPVVGALSGTTSEAAGQATAGTAYEPWARLAGAVAGGGAPGAVEAGWNGAKNLVTNGVKGVKNALVPEPATAANPDSLAGATSRDSVAKIQGYIKDQADAVKQSARGNYQAAKDSGTIANPVAFKRGFDSNVMKQNAENPIDPRVHPEAFKAIDVVNDAIKGPNPLDVTNIQNTRKVLRSIVNTNTDPITKGLNEQGVAANRVLNAFDNTLEQMPASQFKGGKGGVDSLRAGISDWSKYRQTYVAPKAVRGLIMGDPTVEQIRTTVFGTQNTLKSAQAGKNANALMSAAGPNAPEVAQLLKASAAQHLLEASQENGALSLPRLRNNIRNLSNEAPTLFKTVFNPEEQQKIVGLLNAGKAESIGNMLGSIGGMGASAAVGTAIAGAPGAGAALAAAKGAKMAGSELARINAENTIKNIVNSSPAGAAPAAAGAETAAGNPVANALMRGGSAVMNDNMALPGAGQSRVGKYVAGAAGITGAAGALGASPDANASDKFSQAQSDQQQLEKMMDSVGGIGATSAPAGNNTAPMAVSPTDRDAAIRTIWGEARGEGQGGEAAVANVILNRAASGKYGKTISQIVQAKNQFEPWNNPQTRADMQKLDPKSPEYQAIAQVFDQVASGKVPDPTNGATHFIAAALQKADGRAIPAWAQGKALAQIGNHTFFSPDGAPIKRT